MVDLIIENTFEGLIRINDDGEIKPGMADKWEVSSDGLTYGGIHITLFVYEQHEQLAEFAVITPHLETPV